MGGLRGIDALRDVDISGKQETGAKDGGRWRDEQSGWGFEEV